MVVKIVVLGILLRLVGLNFRCFVRLVVVICCFCYVNVLVISGFLFVNGLCI